MTCCWDFFGRQRDGLFAEFDCFLDCVGCFARHADDQSNGPADPGLGDEAVGVVLVAPDDDDGALAAGQGDAECTTRLVPQRTPRSIGNETVAWQSAVVSGHIQGRALAEDQLDRGLEPVSIKECIEAVEETRVRELVGLAASEQGCPGYRHPDPQPATDTGVGPES